MALDTSDPKSTTRGHVLALDVMHPRTLDPSLDHVEGGRVALNGELSNDKTAQIQNHRWRLWLVSRGVPR